MCVWTLLRVWYSVYRAWLIFVHLQVVKHHTEDLSLLIWAFPSINNAGVLNYSLMSRILKMTYWDFVTFLAFYYPFSFISFLLLLLHIQTHVMHPWRMLLSRCHSKPCHYFNQGLKKLKHSTNDGFKVADPQQISTWRATSWVHSHFFPFWWQFGFIFPTLDQK